MADKRMKELYDKMPDELKAIVDKAEQEYDKDYDYISNGQKIYDFVIEIEKPTHWHMTNYAETDINKASYTLIGFLCSPNRDWKDVTGMEFF